MIRFLVDAQLPKKLARLLEEAGYDTFHTLDLPEGNRTKDQEINRRSIEEKRIVVTKDEDFVESLLISDKPYKLLIVRTGNITNRELLALVERSIPRITQAFLENRLIEITQDKLIIYE
jgi:predicted nuclease of predicted toxin-antitoxin system